MPLRAALIGYGLAGSVFHAPLIAATEGLELSTVVTGDRARAAAASRAYPGVRIEATPEAVFERAGAHDLVVVASPNDTHLELATRAVDLGIPVVVDKPLAPTAGAAAGLVEHAERAGVPLTVFHNRRWDSDQLTLRRLIGDGRLGDVLRFESRFERWRPELRSEAWRDTATPAEGGGVLLDLGTHLVDQALILFGPVRHVHGEVLHRRGGSADDDAFLALEHAGGVRSHLWASLVTAAPGPRLRALGSEAAYVVEDLDGQEDALRSGLRPDTVDGWGVEPAERRGSLIRGEHSEPVRSEPGAWPRFYEQLVAAIGGEGPLPVDPWDAVAVLEILERARS
ncbi:MAG: Gfo/Idh/MocA family oxidoreductase [Solirubrobacterales bacterium]